MNIGFFDSGIGGLSILREVLKRLPQYDYVYLADNLHVPYGERSAEDIYNLTTKAIEYLFKNDCSLVIIACNTATTTSLRKIQQQYLPKKSSRKKSSRNYKSCNGRGLRTESKSNRCNCN